MAILTTLMSLKMLILLYFHPIEKVWIWKRYHIVNPDMPSPVDGHGWIVHEGYLQP